jgi:hypothetical protein
MKLRRLTPLAANVLMRASRPSRCGERRDMCYLLQPAMHGTMAGIREDLVKGYDG